MARTVASFRPNDPLTQGELSNLVAELTEEPPEDAGRTRGAGDDGPARRAARPRARAWATTRRPSRTQPRRRGSVLRRASEPRSSRACSACARTTRPARTISSGSPTTPRRARRPPTRSPRSCACPDWEKHERRGRGRPPSSSRCSPRGSARVLTTAVKFIGYPYVWGGECETPQSPYGAQAAGRIRLLRLRLARLQASVVSRRPAARRTRCAAEPLPRWPARCRAGMRIKPARLAPADLMFFGPGGPRAKPARIDHVGDLPRQRLADPVVAVRRRARSGRRLVREPARLGPAPARRSRPLAAEPSFQGGNKFPPYG